MILTPIPCAELAGTRDRFMGGLSDKLSWEAFARIRATSPDRAAGAEAEQHRPSFDNTDHALEQSYDSGYFGAVMWRAARAHLSDGMQARRTTE